MTRRRIPHLLCAALLSANVASLSAQTCPAPDEDLPAEVREERKKRDEALFAQELNKANARLADARKLIDRTAEKLIHASTPMEWVIGAHQMAGRPMIDLSAERFTNRDEAEQAFRAAVEAMEMGRKSGRISNTDIVLERAYSAGKTDPAILFALTAHCLTQRSSFCTAHTSLPDELLAADPDNGWSWLLKSYWQTGELAMETARKALATQRFKSYLQPQFAVIQEIVKQVPADADAGFSGPLVMIPSMVAIRPTAAILKVCAEVMANTRESAPDASPKPLTESGETCRKLLHHVATHADDSFTPQIARSRLQFVFKVPADQLPAGDALKRSNDIVAGLFALSKDGMHAQPGAADRIIRQGLAWTAAFGEPESERRMLEAVQLLVPTAKAASAQ